MIIEQDNTNSTRNIAGLSQVAASFLSSLAGREQTVFRFREALDFWQDPAAARSALSRLQRNGWLQRIERGLYMLIPLDAGPQRVWTENALVIASHLLQPSAIAYWSALHYWGLTEQIPRTVFVQSPKRKSKREITVAGMPYHFITVQEGRFFGLVQQAIAQHTIQLTDREKTLIDAADRLDLSGGIWQLVETLQRHWSELDWEKLDAYLTRFNSGAVIKRLGYVIEALDLPIPDRADRLAQWQRQLTTGIAQLEPGPLRKGPVLRRWRVRDNVGLVGRSSRGQP
jgi:predicted transcriptional regulator of viral defense system